MNIDNVFWEYGCTANRFVAFLDVAGFTQMLKPDLYNKDAEEILCSMKDDIDDKYKDCIKSHIYDINKHREVLRFMTGCREIEGVAINHITKDEELIKCIQISDSIIVLSRDDSEESFSQIISFCSVLVSNYIANGRAIRGYVSEGVITFDPKNNIMFGNAYIEAYKKEGTLCFFGVVVDEKIKFRHRLIKKVVIAEKGDKDKDQGQSEIKTEKMIVDYFWYLSQVFARQTSNRSIQQQCAIERINELNKNISPENEKRDTVRRYIQNTIEVAKLVYAEYK